MLASIGLVATREPLGGPVYRTLARIFISKDELRSLVAALRREEDPKPDGVQVFTRAGVLSAIKLALALGENPAESPNDLTLVGSYLLDVNDFVAGARYRSGQGSSDYKALMLEMLVSWDLSNPPDLSHALGRAYTMLREITRTDDDRVQALARALPQTLDSLEFDGVTLDDYIAILFGIYSRLSTLDLDDMAVGRANAVIDPETYLGETKFPRDQFLRFLENRAKDVSAVRESLLRTSPRVPTNCS